MRDTTWHYRNFYVLFFIVIVIILAVAWKCCPRNCPEECCQKCPKENCPICPEEGCFPGTRAWTLGPSNNPNVLPGGGELILSKAPAGESWRAFIRIPGMDDATFICEDSDGLSGGIFYCANASYSLKAWSDEDNTCGQDCCIRYELCVGSGCADSGGEKGSDGGGNTGSS